MQRAIRDILAKHQAQHDQFDATWQQMGQDWLDSKPLGYCDELESQLSQLAQAAQTGWQTDKDPMHLVIMAGAAACHTALLKYVCEKLDVPPPEMSTDDIAS